MQYIFFLCVLKYIVLVYIISIYTYAFIYVCVCIYIYRERERTCTYVCFFGSSTGKEPVCDPGDPGSIPGLGRCPGEGRGSTLLCPWASLVAQTVKNPPAMQEPGSDLWGWEDALENGMATHSSILAWRIPWTEEPVGYSPWGCNKVDTTERLSTAQHGLHSIY